MIGDPDSDRKQVINLSNVNSVPHTGPHILSGTVSKRAAHRSSLSRMFAHMDGHSTFEPYKQNFHYEFESTVFENNQKLHSLIRTKAGMKRDDGSGADKKIGRVTVRKK